MDVTCSRCMRDVNVQVAPAQPESFLCLTCQVVTGGNQTPQLTPPSLNVRRPLWPYALAIGAVAVGVTAAYFWKQRMDAQDRLESEFPVLPSPSDRLTIRTELPAWTKGRNKLVAALKTFDPAQVRVAPGAAACPIGQSALSASEVEARNWNQDASPDSVADMIAAVRDPDADVVGRLRVGPQLASAAASKLDTMIASARRGRFRTHQSLFANVDALDNDALIVVDIRSESEPKIDRVDGKRMFIGGHRTGHAYAFDRTTGALRCAGAFEAQSSDSVAVLESPLGLGNEHESVDRDFEAQTDRAIAAALHVVAAAGDPNGQPLPLPSADAVEHFSPEQIAEREAGCKSGTAEACTDLGVAMKRGDIRDEPERRIALFQQGCEGGDQVGCTFLGSALVVGRDTERDVPKGLSLLDTACTAEQWTACYMLGSVYGSGELVRAEPERAKGYYQKACDNGMDDACTDLGTLTSTGASKDP